MLNVTVYNRHRKNCTHLANRFWKKCDCPKWIYWHRDGKENRITADTGEWNVASEKALKIEMQYRETLDPKPPQEMVVQMAVLLYLEDRKAQHLRDSTISKLTTIFDKQFAKWCHANDLHLLRQITLPHLQMWRSTWKDGALAAKKKQERVRGFFYFCQRNKWISDNPALGLSRIKADNQAADYFTQDEFKKIIVAVDQFGKTEAQRARLKGLVYLMRWSGLAIRDAVTLERSMLGADDRLILRRAKTGVAVMLPLQTQIAHYLRHMMPHSNERYFFWSGKGLPKSAVADWQRSLRRLFDLADLKHPGGTKKRCYPHMFRHTFSIQMLLAGVPVEDVARLLGHASVRTTEKYYSSWVKARADRLEQSVMASWVT
jgi:site-specific recombinase XerD